jgi:Archaeal IMP cyclohydrolase
MNLEQLGADNIKKLQENEYPGRGIVIGMSPDGKKYIQLYWIMGRSENSRNRVFEVKENFVRTKAFDESKMTDPSLIIYDPIKSIKDYHIVGNGNQTDTIYDYIINGDTFENALNTREFEPDCPNYTPRISGIIDLSKEKASCALSILKSLNGDDSICQRNYYHYSSFLKGYGHCIHTYKEDGSPIPSFKGEPFIVKLYDDINKNAEHFWNVLNDNNKISLLVKYIDVMSKETEIKIINRNQENI